MLVASLSRWAPMCIGPYAQCVTVDDALVYPAGQIGLLPETMALVGGGLQAQLQQALLNLARVCAGAGSGLPCALSVIVYVARAELSAAAVEGVQQGVREWVASREEEGGEEDGEGSGEEDEEGGAGSSNEVEDREYEFSLGPFARHCAGAGGMLPPCAVIPVAALPRGAAVEVEALCLTGEAMALFGGVAGTLEGEQEGEGPGSLHFDTRARLLPGSVGCVWVSGCGPGALEAGERAGSGQAGQTLLQRLALGCAQKALRCLQGSGQLCGPGCSWSVRIFFEAGVGGEEREEGEAVEEALRAALAGQAGHVAIASVPLSGEQGGSGPALLPRGPAAVLPGCRAVLVQVVAHNLGALRGQLWLRRAYKLAGV